MMVFRKLLERSLPWRAWHCLKWALRGVRLHHMVLISGDHRGLKLGKHSKIGERCVLQLGPGAQISLGEKCWLYKDVEFRTDDKINIGNRTTFQKNVTINGSVDIGADCLIAPNVFITSGTHRYQYIPELSIREQERRWEIDKNLRSPEARIEIGDDCWIGVNVVITPGVSIGKGCVIGANSVVNRSIPPYTVAVGAPARVINKRLNWNPPSDLDGTKTNSIPYLYRGFEIAYGDGRIKANIRDVGKIALDGQHKGTAIELTIRSSKKGTLRHGVVDFDFGIGDSTLIVPIFNRTNPEEHFIFDFSVSGYPQLLRCRWLDCAPN